MKKFGVYIFITLFAIIISIPLLLFTFKLKVNTPIGEKKMNLNFERNFPLKTNLINTFSFLKESLFHKNPLPEKVISVNNDWKFLSNIYGNALSESKGIIQFTKTELKQLEERLVFRKRWLEKRNVKLYIAVAPNKHTTYGHLIPIRQAVNKTKMQQLDSLCKNNGINYINLGKQFPKKGKKLLYFKTDTHWNEYGAFHGFKETIEYISKDFPNKKFNNFKINELTDKTGEVFFKGDLNKILKEESSERYTALIINKNQQQATLEKNLMPIPKYFKKDPTKYEKRWTTSINNLKILIFHDSFYHGFEKFMVENFKNTISIWDHKFNETLISNTNPDILYHEILERDIDILLEY